MRIINEKYENLIFPSVLSEYSDEANVLFFDIETTGLKKETTSLYLIGCGYYIDSYLNTRFYFADSEDEELLILKEFFDFARGFKAVIHFNGTTFDLPYLSYKAQKYNIINPLKTLESIDIYKLIKPLRYLLFRESMRQKCVEDFCGIERKDQYNGGELIEVYKQYVINKSEELLSLLLLHNREDVIGMHKIIPILNYLKLKDCNLSYIKALENSYESLDGTVLNELIINYNYDLELQKPFSINNNNMYFRFSVNPGILSVRLLIRNGKLNHYYENYNDYVYLVEEKRCIHKSLAGAIDKSLKTKAKKDYCYTEVSGEFLPSMGFTDNRSCGESYKTRNDYILKPDYSDVEFYNKYGQYLLIKLLNSKPKKHANKEI